jgi:hypothetical protein
MNNSWLWICSHWNFGEGGWSDQREEGCTNGYFASNLFQHGGLSLEVQMCTARRLRCRVAKAESFTRGVA